MIRDQPVLLEVREDFTRLACCQSPAEVKLEIATLEDGCQLRLATRVPGFGPVSSSHARGRHAALVRSVYSHLTEARRKMPDGYRGDPDHGEPSLA